MSFWVLDLEAGPPRLRGALSRWAVELRAGLYVGTCSAKARDAIWTLVTSALGSEARAVLVFPSSTRPMGFDVRTAGVGRREMVEVDGLLLARFLPEVAADVPPPTAEPLEEP